MIDTHPWFQQVYIKERKFDECNDRLSSLVHFLQVTFVVPYTVFIQSKSFF